MRKSRFRDRSLFLKILPNNFNEMEIRICRIGVLIYVIPIVIEMLVKQTLEILGLLANSESGTLLYDPVRTNALNSSLWTESLMRHYHLIRTFSPPPMTNSNNYSFQMKRDGLRSPLFVK